MSISRRAAGLLSGVGRARGDRKGSGVISKGEGDAEAEAKNFGVAPRRDEDDVGLTVRPVSQDREDIRDPGVA
jgi:hypothetical protein